MGPTEKMFKLNFLLLLSLVFVCEGKIYEKCELARALRDYGFPRNQIATWVCIAKHESNYDTRAINHQSKDYGIFQISALYWCSLDGQRKECGISCESLLGDSLDLDFGCIKKIYAEWQRLENNGFKAWVTYSKCLNPYEYDCFSRNEM